MRKKIYCINTEKIDVETGITCDVPSCKRKAQWEVRFLRIPIAVNFPRHFYFCKHHRASIDLVDFLVTEA